MKSIWLLGNPISHSLSPTFQNAGLQHLNIEAKYSVRAVDIREFSKVMAEMRSGDVLGANITIPYKTTIMDHMDEIDPFAISVGAVNTVLVQHKDSGTRLVGYNTDVRGIIDPIINSGFELPKSRAVLIGTGGAALSAFQALVNLDVSHVDIIARNVVAAAAFVNSSPSVDVSIHDLAHIEHDTFASLIAHADLIVQATPVGMHSGLSPNSSPIPEEVMRQGLTKSLGPTLIFELVYAPRETVFLRLAREYGNNKTVYIEGLEMLLHQGAESFKIWTEHSAPIQIMRASLGLADV
jgi:shikimate dehydrogenase